VIFLALHLFTAI